LALNAQSNKARKTQKKERNVAATPKVHRLICHRSEKKVLGNGGKWGKTIRSHVRWYENG